MADDVAGAQGSLEDSKQEEGRDGLVKRWLMEIDLAKKRKKDWVNDVKNALKVYNSDEFRDDEHTKRKETFNILWSNVETKRPALYNTLPRPDVRRRFRDENIIGRHVSELLERGLSFQIEDNFDEEMIMGVNDMLLPGRAVTRVGLESTMSEGEGEDFVPEILSQKITFDQVQWDDFDHGPGKRWKDVTWVSYRHFFTKDEIEERFPEFVEKITFDHTPEIEDKESKSDKSDNNIFKTAKVYEVWDKKKREQLWIAPSYKESPLEVNEDPLELKGFFNIARPLYAIENPTTLIPTTEYSMYETLARELEVITARINRVVDGIRLRGIYDATLVEIEQLFDAPDNEFIPSEDTSRLIEGKGLDNAIWMLPIGEMAEVLVHLYDRRDSLVQEIYQITGISDIMRGATNPHETLGAQELKSNFGTQRLQRQQREVQRYARDLLRIAAELMANNFSQELFEVMTGLHYPSQEEKFLAEQAIAAAEQQGQEAPPEALEVLELPAWEELDECLRSDLLREFKVDVETDSTIQMEQGQDQERVTNLLTGIMNFMDGMAPAVQQGVLPLDAAKKILLAAVRRFKLGREVEDALEQIGEGEQENPEDQAQQVEMQVKQAEAEAKMQEIEAQRQAAADDARFKAEAHKDKMEELQMKRLERREKHQAELEKIRAQAAAARVQPKEN